ncbi:double-strand break repair helicase AddA [Acidiphilium sp. PA]|uniref:double-strand break repair helicase AddA n=1 Tax=Acidiphilium sp. PA TaxID=2871705 RepID=UPI002242EE54|nr:double-strand break repair helicase AddA [Acidiphilium sp. PA]MCW8308418.1 double-strand break repair helicase AddA [Acidiphilium sp. PA]
MSGASLGAEAAQRAASDPAVSAFVGASAGSGKTKLLTDRLLRLMLAGAPPARILCLTFTRAAAAEMAIRLRDRLGRWAIASEAALDADLASLDVMARAAVRARARALFGQVLDLPGGMRIDTIHAFCQSLLRRFPLEAGVSPHFIVADEAESALRKRAAREDWLSGRVDEPYPALQRLAGEISEVQFGALVDRLLADSQAHLARLLDRHGEAGAIMAMQRAAVAAPDASDAQLWDEAVRPDEAALRPALDRISRQSSPAARNKALLLLDWLACDPASRLAGWSSWLDGFLTGKGEPRKPSGLISKTLDQAAPELAGVLAAEQARILRCLDRFAAKEVAALSAALTEVVLPIHAVASAGKLRESRFDYGDLIALAARLLFDPGAAWVLFKLDGGIDHILLDEVQDIAPSQWGVIDAIAREFFAGDGAKADVRRTIFAVGDRKQSIYSFQGADLASFDAWRTGIGGRVRAAAARWHEGTLATSFRSSAPVLALVDRVFEGVARAGVVLSGEALVHGVSRAGQAGSVALWPLADPDPEADLPAWAPAERYARQDSARRRLAEGLAGWIAANIDVMKLESRGRTLQAGDILILVRSRNEFGPALTRALKDAGVPVAGLDRMVLTETRAVADLVALAQAVLLPEDDVAVATVLASPLGGLSDDELMALAIGRSGTLRDALFARADETPAYRAARDFFAAVQARADFVSPYRLFAEVLGALGGRARLLARLGPEAAEPIDELLATALDYGQREAPSLQGFLAALEASAAEIKREAEAAGDRVRLMTVHGAKGLQAPLVILPDTTSVPQQRETLYWLTVPQSEVLVPVFCPRADLRSSAVAAAVAAAGRLMIEEYNRLLYVALTRAEDHLVVCGAAPKKALLETCWYEAVRVAIGQMDGVAEQDVALPWAAQAMGVSCAQTAAPDRIGRHVAARMAALPGWIGPETGWRAAAPPEPPDLVDRLVPSRSAEGEARGLAAASPRAGARAAGRAAAMARGRLIHALLQHLPAVPATDRRDRAAAYVAQAGHGLDRDAQHNVVDAVMQVLDHPALASLFGPGSRAEAPVAGVVQGVEIGGLIDRLVVLPDRIMLADFKTDRQPPADAAAIPLPYLAQLAAYAAVLGAIYPGRAVQAMLVWTANGTVMPVPESVLARHAPRRQQGSGGGAGAVET